MGNTHLKAHLNISVQVGVFTRRGRNKGNKEIRGRGCEHAGSVHSGPDMDTQCEHPGASLHQPNFYSWAICITQSHGRGCFLYKQELERLVLTICLQRNYDYLSSFYQFVSISYSNFTPLIWHEIDSFYSLFQFPTVNSFSISMELLMFSESSRGMKNLSLL